MGELVERKIGKNIISWLPLDDKILSRDDVYTSWCGSNFIFKQENAKFNIQGLRPPQVGGIYAALGAEMSDDNSAATIVMPTGTGKTETILSMVVAGKFERTLVIVPSDALREQINTKFIHLGLLRKLGLIGEDIANPVTAMVKQGIDNESDLNAILDSNVIIASASVLSKFSPDYFSKLTQKCSHLIVDEAHHVTAATWARVKACFDEKSVFQFTATPFRTDRSRVEGRIIFNYPLKKAQDDGYFKPIEFHPVREFVEECSDQAIAEKTIMLLRADLAAGFNHIAMARAQTIKRATEIFELYKDEIDLNPVLINSKVKKKSEVLDAIKAGKHRIIICVDMLGEGFDLPQLKISAIHDPHKSINIMLQFTGRFTRTTQDVGNAKFIANIANADVNESLDELYKEDSDWNNIISDISSKQIRYEKEYQEFRSKFTTPSKLLDLGLTPNISTTVYNMKLAAWDPDKFHKFCSKYFQLIDFVLNDEKDILIFSVKSYNPVGWTSSRELFDESWDLYIAFYDKNLNLLFIHSSAKDGLVRKLVESIAHNASQIQGERVFRALSGVKRLKLQNVGLNKNKKGLRYSMHTGTEINDQIPDIEAKRSIKSNIFGKGYENGVAVSIGCSYKGKIWAMDSDSLDKWILWCKGVGNKILDNTIDTNKIMKTVMQTEEIEEFPALNPLAVEWPVELLRKNESKVTITSSTWTEKNINCELTFSNIQSGGNKSWDIELTSIHGKSLVTATILQKGEVKFTSLDDLDIIWGEQKHKLTDFFNEYPPVFFMADTSIVDGGFRYYPCEEYAYLYEINNIDNWDWSGVDISVESQTEKKLVNSIQYHTIHKILDSYDVVFDDDGAGEVADIVAIKNINNNELIIDLYHCKYCLKTDGIARPGARIDDVYQVAGQAIKSVKWFGDKEKLILRLIDRERSRLAKGKASRIEKGNLDDLFNLAKISRYSSFRLGISIVQPAISKAVISNEQLSVLGATETYINEVSGVKLKIIVSQ
ncbi:DEAD/DEAH box helicase [Klebsiella variicola]|uniref:DEAD/DEAH box helicase n=1 Tax=Klebsiella variicola TaxID=244366 RepID=UPI0009BBABDF|nr:DEAD/DEAH box helicase family protein [Klebsiella variicola]SLW61680.1 type I restriction enzyme EcoKI subunit R [Klebsiella variicola]SLX05339.1 type I restriction enzyme EcoKI subunit R [Klebsiella variicola]